MLQSVSYAAYARSTGEVLQLLYVCDRNCQRGVAQGGVLAPVLLGLTPHAGGRLRVLRQWSIRSEERYDSIMSRSWLQ